MIRFRSAVGSLLCAATVSCAPQQGTLFTSSGGMDTVKVPAIAPSTEDTVGARPTRSAFREWYEDKITAEERAQLNHWAETFETVGSVDVSLGLNRAGSLYPNPPIPPAAADSSYAHQAGYTALFKFAEVAKSFNETKLTTAEQVAAATTIKFDKYQGAEGTSSPEIRHMALSPPLQAESWQLIAVRPKDEPTVFWLAVTHVGDGPLLLSAASDANARSFELRPEKSDVLSGSEFEEVVALKVTRDYLAEAARGDGIDIRVSGKRGNVQVALPAFFAKGFLAKVDQQRSASAPTSRSATPR